MDLLDIVTGSLLVVLVVAALLYPIGRGGDRNE